jgi:hypothetical protein
MSNLLDHAVEEHATTQPNILAGLATRPFETLFASMVLFVLRVMRPKPPFKHVRLEWFCTCGVQMYAYYPESDVIMEFRESLGDTQERPTSFAHAVGDEGRLKLLSVATNWISGGLVVALTSMLGSRFLSMTTLSRDLDTSLQVSLCILALVMAVISVIFAGKLTAPFHYSRSARGACADIIRSPNSNKSSHPLLWVFCVPAWILCATNRLFVVTSPAANVWS